MFYYQQPPKIVESIDREAKSAAIYETLHQVIRDCVKAIHAESYQDAFRTYVGMVLQLRSEYTPDMDVPESIWEASRSLSQVSTSVMPSLLVNR